MIVTNKTQKSLPIFVVIRRVFKSFPKSIFKPVPVKFPFKYFLITVLSTIIIWSLLASAIIYRNAYKPDVSELADLLHFKGLREKHRTGKAIKAFLLAPFNWIHGNLFSEEIPHIYIDLKFKNYQKLLNIREKALESGFLVSNFNEYVPAKIKHKGNSYKVKLRLKGDQADHWGGEKWSFRIHMKGKNHLFGMRRFSLQNPSTRNFEGELIFFEALKREELLALRYFFVDLTVNGKYIGVMACEEHFSKELLESQKRKESVILKFNEGLLFYDRAGPFDNFMTSDIKAFRSNKIKNSKTLSKDLEMATSLLRGFANGTLSTSQVFDVDLMGRYMAVSSVWGAWHPMRWRNIRFYYNPITARLEPIGYDAHLPYFKRASVEPVNKNPFGAAVMESDPEIRPYYEATLKKLKREAREGITKKWALPIQKRSLRILHKEYPLLGGINLFGLERAASESLKRSQAALTRYQEILKAHLIESEAGDYLEIVNPLPHQIIISSIKWVNKKTGERINFNTAPALKYPIRVLRTPKQTIPRSIKLYFSNFESMKNFRIHIFAHIEGGKKTWITEATPYFPMSEENPVPTSTLPEVLAQHPFLIFQTDSNSLRVKQGTWKVHGSLVVPKGLPLIIPKGTTLSFGPASALIVKAPLIIQGTAAEPVILAGVEGTGHNKTWQGIVVQKSGSPSKWSHVIVRDTTGINLNGWNLSGGVNFYEADIQMKDVTLIGNQSEDALNIVRSKFELKNVTIKNTASDAFDSDFSSGIVQGGLYENIGHASGGGDGIDVSGSEVTVTETVFKNISDKALSVGEQSAMTATGISIEQVGTAAVSKDKSHLILKNAKINRVKTPALMAYTKKKEYGPGTIVASQLDMQSIANPAVAQKGSHISIDGKDIEQTDLNVKELYSTLTKSVINK